MPRINAPFGMVLVHGQCTKECKGDASFAAVRFHSCRTIRCSALLRDSGRGMCANAAIWRTDGDCLVSTEYPLPRAGDGSPGRQLWFTASSLLVQAPPAGAVVDFAAMNSTATVGKQKVWPQPHTPCTHTSTGSTPKEEIHPATTPFPKVIFATPNCVPSFSPLISMPPRASRPRPKSKPPVPQAFAHPLHPHPSGAADAGTAQEGGTGSRSAAPSGHPAALPAPASSSAAATSSGASSAAGRDARAARQAAAAAREGGQRSLPWKGVPWRHTERSGITQIRMVEQARG